MRNSDEIAGHFRRYIARQHPELGADTRWNVIYRAGPTFPISNSLLLVSNFLVYRSEGSKLALSPLERTKEFWPQECLFRDVLSPAIALLLNGHALHFCVCYKI